jgi:hypothetical protein
MPSNYAPWKLHELFAFAAFFEAWRVNRVQTPYAHTISLAHANRKERRAMTEVFQRSAEIIPFPAGRVRRTIDGQAAEPSPAADLRPQRVSSSIGGAWYHDAAIQDSKRATEH